MYVKRGGSRTDGTLRELKIRRRWAHQEQPDTWVCGFRPRARRMANMEGGRPGSSDSRASSGGSLKTFLVASRFEPAVLAVERSVVGTTLIRRLLFPVQGGRPVWGVFGTMRGATTQRMLQALMISSISGLACSLAEGRTD